MNFNFEIFSLVLCIISFLSLTFFVYKKMPVLSGLPEREMFPGVKIRKEAEEKLKIVFKQKLHSLEGMLQKNLHRSRVLLMRADNRATDWIYKLKERSDKRKIDLEDPWKDLKITLPIKKSKKKD
ncbi:hypothetical protein M0Q03_00655 [bacterium]|jgi:hypothetical protein|nr:hypothetical protein [bacterium]